jgi:thiosulfate dehydrogenase
MPRTTRLALLFLFATVAAACSPKPEGAASAIPPAGVSATAVAPPPKDYGLPGWQPPSTDSIGDDSLGASVERGLALLRHTKDSLPGYATSSLNCTSCHLEDGLRLEAAPLTGAAARFPKYMERTGAVIPLADRVNYCFTRSLAGNRLPVESREMQDILAYLAYISKGVPVGAKIAGTRGLLDAPDTLAADKARGGTLFAEKCAACHGAEGQGQALYPALWGPKSYSVGASMARLERAASFIQRNMPFGMGGTLSWQDAFDIAAYINSHARPDSPGKELDWPLGGAPADVPYDTKGHQAYNPPPLLERATPARAVVAKPAAAPRGRT